MFKRQVKCVALALFAVCSSMALADPMVAPVFDPAGGTFTAAQNVVITCETRKVTIHYTTNGVDPTEDDPIIASGESVLVDQSMTLKATAWKGQGNKCATTSADYTIDYPYSGGSGTADDPYRIANKKDLLELAATPTDYGCFFIVTADIDLADEVFTTAIIAPDTDTPTADFQGPMFSGVFDGNDHTISNLTINAGTTGNDYLGLFGCISEVAFVKRLGVENVAITGTGGSVICGGIVGLNMGSVQDSYSSGSIAAAGSVGGLVGGNRSGGITSSHSTANVTGSGSYIGGLAGTNFGVIRQSYATGTVSGNINVGGLVGTNSMDVIGIIDRCFATGNVSGCYVGGLAGSNSGTISDSYARGNVTLTTADCIGGLVGWRYAGSISRCYSTGYISGSHNAGGLIGYTVSGTTTASFWDTQTSGKSSSAGGTGRTTTLMKTQSTFTGWDFVGETANGTNDYWRMVGGSYPILSYQ